MKQRFINFFRKIKQKLKNLTFYKKKPFYIVLTVIFSVLLLADILIAVFVPNQQNAFGNMQRFDTSDLDMSDLDADSSEMPDGDSSGFGGGGRGQGGGRGDWSEDSSDGSTSDSTGADTDSDSADSSTNADTSDSTDSSANAGTSDSTGSGADSSDSMDAGSGDMTANADGMPDMSKMGGGEMPSGSEMPSDGDMSFDSEDMSELTDTMNQNGMGGGPLRAIRSHWLVILIVLMILDGLSIFRLIWISRKQKKAEAAALKEEQEKAKETGDVHIVHKSVKKKKHSHYLWIIPLAGMLLLVIIVNALTAQSTSTEAETEASVHSGTAELSEISSVVPGAGTLAEETAETLDLPEDVEITTWYVSDGDTVEAGDKLAKVDQVSVLSAIASVQEKLTALDEELVEQEDATVSETITAAADGRVMAIYAIAGNSVTDTMYAYSSLMLISLDGMMAVSIETDEDLAAGDSVNVTLSDSTTVLTGKVESMTNGTAVITVSDESTSLGESVTVETEDGDEIGSGTLYIHSELTVTGYTGTISSVSVSIGDEVSSGDTLITLADTEYTGEYELLVEQRTELEEQMQTLFTLYQEEYVYATCAGVISGLDDSSDSTSTSTDSSDDSSDGSDDLSDDSSDDSSDSSANSASGDSSDTTARAGEAASGAQTASSASAAISLLTASADLSVVSKTTDTELLTSLITTSINLNTTAAASSTAVSSTLSSLLVHSVGVVTEVADGNVQLLLLPDSYLIDDYSDLSWLDLSLENMTEESTVTLYTNIPVFTYMDEQWVFGSVDDIEAGDILILAYNTAYESESPFWIIRTTQEDAANSGTDAAEEPSETEAADTSGTSESGTDSTGSGSSISGGDSSNTSGSSTSDSTGTTDSRSSSSVSTGLDISSFFGITSSTDTTADSDSSTGTDASGSDMSGSDSTSTDMTGVTSGETDSAGTDKTGTASGSDDTEESSDTSISEAASEIASAYGVSETTWLSITPQDTMTIEITIDEMDILSLEVGQEAQVTLDAFPGQSFDGEVTTINLSGTNSGGSSKYTAEITITREEDMLVGMNASVVITLDTKEDVLSIPEDALVEEDDAVYVYTTYDEDTDTLGDLVEVTTGVSDGENVEILSGLSEGDEYYYSILDVVNYSYAFSSSGSGSFSLESMFSSGSGGRGGM